MASEEALVNIVNHAYPDKDGDIAISCEGSEKRLKIEIRDTGLAFNPLEVPDPDINLPLEKRRIGGLGILMIRQSMDEVSYKRENDQNILTLIKNAG